LDTHGRLAAWSLICRNICFTSRKPELFVARRKKRRALIDARLSACALETMSPCRVGFLPTEARPRPFRERRPGIGRRPSTKTGSSTRADDRCISPQVRRQADRLLAVLLFRRPLPCAAAVPRRIDAGRIRKSSSFFPDLSSAVSQRGCFPRPAQVSASRAGFLYFGKTCGYGRRAWLTCLMLSALLWPSSRNFCSSAACSEDILRASTETTSS
jgi:hypothetical protein